MRSLTYSNHSNQRFGSHSCKLKSQNASEMTGGTVLALDLLHWHIPGRMTGRGEAKLRGIISLILITKAHLIPFYRVTR